MYPCPSKLSLLMSTIPTEPDDEGPYAFLFSGVLSLNWPFSTLRIERFRSIFVATLWILQFVSVSLYR